jgi:glycosyltransferase involved in cell wall biosynthesis
VTAGNAAEDGAAQPEDLEALRDQHREELIQLRGDLMKRLMSLQASRQELADRLKEQVAATWALERSLREAQRQMQAIYESRTWRVGSVVRRVFRPMSPDIEQRVISIPDVPPAQHTESVSPFVVAPPAVDPHPLATEYRAEIMSPHGHDGRGVGFAVSTTNFGEGRGDLFVAAGLGRYLRRRGYQASYFPLETWHQASGLDWVVAMLPGFRPSSIEGGSKVLGWARNSFGDWLTHPELDKFDVLLTSSPRFAIETREVYSGDVHLVPIGVDLELFESSGTRPHEGVVTTTNQWGGERDLYLALRSSPVNYPLQIYGQPAGLSAELHSHYLGPVDYFELPGIYSRAQIVLDDSHPAVVGWGAVNSRIFDSIAAGALPVTNARDGLEELGLSEVPVYSEPSQLNELVDALLHDAEGTRSRVARLRSVVERRHSYDVRAAEIVQILARSST